MPPPLLYDLSHLNFDQPLYDIHEIRTFNPQRFEMEQLTGILSVDQEQHGLVGFKDITPNEFWARGHMPDYPLMPGVIICEAVAQLASFYSRKFNLLEGDVVGFGGMDEVRFRAPVFPGCRLILLARCIKLRAKKLATFDFQAVVDDQLVASGQMIGTAFSRANKTGNAD